ncbi:c-type cytochrome [Rhizobium sp. NXC24]|uniref:c-type cytochrome n=2 Tax=unclassified Rhizobium TaxID=2613769 RepID=UPI000CDF519E|nr:c-type cytochrome [Rhizobium sp. NXC24]AVA23680.1 cytochrome-c domain-containing protein [Rhizobium sp. NXC24]
MFTASLLYRNRGAWLGAAAIALLCVLIGTDMAKDSQQRLQAARLLTQGGDPSRAPPIFRRYGCTGCHQIPGIAGADGQVGGALSGLQKRVYIAGVINNTGDNLVHWIVSPQIFSPNSAMPKTGISEAEARDLAAYLYTH